MENKNLNKFIKKIEKKLEKYFVAYGVKEGKNISEVNIIIEDRDVLRMKKEDLRKKLSGMLKALLEKNSKIKVKVNLLSDLNSSNIWNILKEYAKIHNVEALSSFVKLKLPKDFLDAYENVPEKFKLVDFEKEINKTSKKKYHRNTYQNWLKSLKDAGFIELKNKTYQKINVNYKKKLLDELKENQI